MMHRPGVWAIATFATLVSGAHAHAQTVLIRGANVLNEGGAGWLENHDVLVDDGFISIIGESIKAPEVEGLEVIDASGLYLIPGMIDLHTHLLLHPYDEAVWDEQVLKESLGLRTARGVAAAKATLEAGFTTIRDLGTEGAGYADVGIRDAINQGIVAGPRVLATTRAIVAYSGYAPAGYDPRWDLPVGAQEANGADEVRKVVREQIAAGADWIKVYADSSRYPGKPATPTFSQEELDALVNEAQSANVPVVAHATTSEGIQRAVRAGVKTIEHGYDASDEALESMRVRNVVLCPTLAASESMALYAGWTTEEPDHPRIIDSISLVERARRIGVTIACGSDAGVFDHGDNAREIELLVEYGMSPEEGLRAATATAAAALGMEGELGVIKVGAFGDFVALSDDPLTNVQALRAVVAVVKHGEVVVKPPAPGRGRTSD